jgi:Ni,Fe-hydrogenase III large subunit
VLHEHWPAGVYPLRKDFDIKTKVTRDNEKEYDFTKVEGEGICEIPVGPVHAGIIEPGHFRFSVLGENIINLETRLFYTHKGVEKLAETMKLDQALLLSERIAGDESVANSLAYCQALEKIANAKVPKRALQIRCICAEMERIYNHLGTLAGISTDVGFSYGSARLNILKERMMQLNSEISGSRLLFGVNRIGGVGMDLDAEKLATIINTTQIVQEDFERIVSMLRAKSSVVDRLRNTGIISKKVAIDLGLVGVVARAAGLDVDTRRDHPYAAYSTVSVDTHHDTPQTLMEYKVNLEKRKGDALGRFEVRVEEVIDSIRMIDELVSDFYDDKTLTTNILETLEPYGHALGYAESHRGQTIHWIMVGQDCDSLFRYKVRTASFVNWPSIEQAVLSDIVPDFPIVNKSLDLSYSGNDL